MQTTTAQGLRLTDRSARERGAFIKNSELMMDVRRALKCGPHPGHVHDADGAFSPAITALPASTASTTATACPTAKSAAFSADHPRWTKITTYFFSHFAYLLGKMQE